MKTATKNFPNDSQEVKTRVQLDLSPAHMDRLNWLMHVCSIETRKDLVNAALSLLEWTVKEVGKGKTIVAMDGENHRMTELAMPALRDASTNLRQKLIQDTDILENNRYIA